MLLAASSCSCFLFAAAAFVALALTSCSRFSARSFSRLLSVYFRILASGTWNAAYDFHYFHLIRCQNP